MFNVLLDDKVLQAKFSDLEIRQLPFATVGAINDALFAARDAWRNEIGSVFDRPTSLTLNAVLYTKATKAVLHGEMFLRNEAHKGTPPSRYLFKEVTGGDREEKPIEYLLRRAGIIAADEFVMPARGFPLDASGNLSPGVLAAILSDMAASPEEKAHSTAASRRKRSRRRDISKRQVYFLSRGKGSQIGNRTQHLPRGIYERTGTGFGSSVRMVLAIVKDAPTYSQRFKAVAIAEGAFHKTFPIAFRARLKQGVLTAKIR
mgnify:CR=1 FL=1